MASAEASKLVRSLRAGARLYGHGTQTRALRKCGLSEDYLSNVDPRRIPLGTYLDLVEASGLDPLRQGVCALRPADPVVRFVKDARRIREGYSMPGLIDRARRQAAATKAERAGARDLSAIDAFRYEDPERAARLAAKAVAAARGPVSVAQALGIWASCQRMRYRFDWASGALGLAVEVLDLMGHQALSPVLRRASALLKDRGELELALAVAQRVATRYFEQGALAPFGAAVVDCAVVRAYSDIGEAGRLAKVALNVLTDAWPRDRAAAYHILSRFHASRNENGAAEEAAAGAAPRWASST